MITETKYLKKRGDSEIVRNESRHLAIIWQASRQDTIFDGRECVDYQQVGALKLKQG